MIQERVKAGLERARAQGKRLGRPATDTRKVQAIQADLYAGGVGIIKLAKLQFSEMAKHLKFVAKTPQVLLFPAKPGCHAMRQWLST
jgi:DNA invertase Pin-like site-specific DNA recombinase